MKTHAHRSIAASVSTSVVLLFFIVVSVSAQTPPGGGKLKVMTYNTYVGSEYAGMTTSNYAKFLEAANNMAVDIRASNPLERAQAVARQIAAASPHLVSLQEVATLSTGPTKESLVVESDYLQLLLNALAARGMQYTSIANTTWFATVPSTSGFVYGSWRVVILIRTDLKSESLSFTNADSGIWTAKLPVHLYALDGNAALCPNELSTDLGCRMPMPRGWVSVDVTYRAQQFRFIAAHLDSASYTLEVPQALELLTGPANTSMPVIVAADLNCDCSNPSDLTFVTCTNFSNAGFTDAWTAVHSTPGFSKTLPNLNKRSDYVMVRGLTAVSSAALVGEAPADMTPSGLYPSDHAGVYVKFTHPAW